MMRRWWMGAVLGCAAMTSWSTALAEDERPRPRIVRAVEARGDGTADLVIGSVDVDADLDVVGITVDKANPAPGKFWIGVTTESLSDALRSQLDLEAEVGLWVSQVMDDSPAKAAGLQTHDVLISAALKADQAEHQKLTAIGDLIELVQKAETKPVELVLIRKGKRQTVAVTPAVRPETEETLSDVMFFDIYQQPGNPDRVQILLRQLQEEIGGGPQGVRLRMASPIVVAAPPPKESTTDSQKHFKARIEVEGNGLPEGMTLTITKSEDKPARIEVKKGEGQVWGANENEIDTLPEEARALARSALAGMSQPHLNISILPPQFNVGSLRLTQPMRSPEQLEHLKGLAELHRQLATELTEKGPEHPEIKRIKSKIDALQKTLPQSTPQKAGTASVSKTARVSAGAGIRTSDVKPVPTVTKSAADAAAHIERLEKQMQELLHLQTKQAESQQEQLRELRKLVEKIAAKE